MEQVKIGQFIAELRKEKCMTQSRLAEILCISDKAISKWETGKGLPEVSMLLPLCNALDISINELLSAERIADDNYKRKAEENMMLLLEEKQNKQKRSMSALLEQHEIYDKIKDRKYNLSNYKATINSVVDISECAMNNGLLEIRKYLDDSETHPFIKELINASSSADNLLSSDEIFDVFSSRIRLSDLNSDELIERLIMLQGYIYILQGMTPDRIYNMLTFLFKE